jgi:hypothetical protein
MFRCGYPDRGLVQYLRFRFAQRARNETAVVRSTCRGLSKADELTVLLYGVVIFEIYLNAGAAGVSEEL